MKRVLTYFANKYKGNWEEIYYALERKEKIEINELMNIKSPKDMLTIVDDEYPNNLKLIYKPPFIVCSKGNKELLNSENSISIIGNVDLLTILDLKEKSENLVFILSKNNLDLVDDLIKHNINFIVTVDNKISKELNKDLINKITDSNNLIISEFPVQNNDNKLLGEQPSIRISIGIAQKVLLNYNSKNLDCAMGTTIANAEKVKIFCSNIDELSENEKSKFNVDSINDFGKYLSMKNKN